MTPTTLPNGGVVQVRPIKPTDKQLLLDAFERLGEESRFRSFLHPVRRLTDNELVDLLHRLGTAWEDHPEPGLVELTIDVPEKVLPASELRAALRAAASRKLEAVTR